MALSDDGDTLSVAAGEIGGQQQQILGNMRSSAFGRRPQVNGQEIGENINGNFKIKGYKIICKLFSY